MGSLVTCIIPTFRRAPTLRRAITSILAQSYADLEVLVVDDNAPGTTDSSHVRSIVDGLSDPRVRLISDGRHGNGAIARNSGIAQARGDFIAFLDDDDEWSPDKLAVQVTMLRAFPDAIGVSSWHLLVRSGLVVEACQQPSDFPSKLDILLRRVSLTTPSLVFRRETFIRGLSFDETLSRHQDIQLVLDALSHGTIYVVPEYLTVVHVDDTANRPCFRELGEVKAKFFSAVEPHVSELSQSERTRVENAHAIEMAYAAARDRDLAGLLQGFRVATSSPRTIQDFVSRSTFRLRGRLRARQVGRNMEAFVGERPT